MDGIDTDHSTTLKSGQQAENLALQYLQQQGLSLLARNYRCRRGEIDLIMKHHESVVFVEVRYRRNQDFGGAGASVDQRKQDKLIVSALHYLQENRQAARLPARFDVVAIHAQSQKVAQPHSIQWIQDAFQAQY